MMIPGDSWLSDASAFLAQAIGPPIEIDTVGRIVADLANHDDEPMLQEHRGFGYDCICSGTYYTMPADWVQQFFRIENGRIAADIPGFTWKAVSIEDRSLFLNKYE